MRPVRMNVRSALVRVRMPVLGPGAAAVIHARAGRPKEQRTDPADGNNNRKDKGADPHARIVARPRRPLRGPRASARRPRSRTTERRAPASRLHP